MFPSHDIFIESMFGNFMFPDFTKVEYDEFNEMQKFFLEFLLEERKNSLLTFPVLTEASLNLDEKPKDEEWARFIADIRSRGLSMFSYNDSNAAALASCCFSGKETILVTDPHGKSSYISIEDFVSYINKNTHEVDKHIDTGYSINSLNPYTLEIEPSQITGILKKKNDKPVYKIGAVNLEPVIVTSDHLFLVLIDGNSKRGNIRTVS